MKKLDIFCRALIEACPLAAVMPILGILLFVFVFYQLGYYNLE